MAEQELQQLGLAAPEDIIDACVVRQKKAYPVYDDAYAEHVATVRAELEECFPTLHLIGRNGMHKYNNQDHSMMTAMLCAQNIIAGGKRYDVWQVNEDAEYHEAGDRGESTSGLRQVPRTVPPVESPAPALRGWLASRTFVFLALSLLALPWLLTLGMTRGLTHDEHQHIAAGELIAQLGLLPYKDFAYFHTPYLPFIYGLIFQFTDHLVLGARLFSVACATAALGAMGAAIFHLFRHRGARMAWWAAIGGTVLAISSAVFAESTGRAWNQEPALLLALLAFLAHVAGMPRAHGKWLLLSGALLGLSIGMRLTYAPLVAPFALALWLAPETRNHRTALLGYFSAGLAASLSGLALLFSIAPEQTFFGTFEFAKVNVAYRFGTGEPRTMTLLKKLRFAVKEVMRPDVGLVLTAFIAAAALYLSRRLRAGKLPFGLRFILLIMPFLLMGSLAPSPVFEQYFYPFVFVIVLAAAYALASVPADSAWFQRAAFASLAAIVLSVGMGAHAYKHVDDLAEIKDWDPMKIHAEGVDIRQRIGAGEILTLAPIYALEGGASIYPSFATGPFAWRIAPFLEARKAARLKITVPDSLMAMLSANHPEGILLGKEKRGEEQLDDFAIANSYRMILLKGDDRLWVPTAPPRHQ